MNTRKPRHTKRQIAHSLKSWDALYGGGAMAGLAWEEVTGVKARMVKLTPPEPGQTKADWWKDVKREAGK